MEALEVPHLIANGTRTLFRPPFSSLLALSLIVTMVSDTSAVTPDTVGLILTFLLLAIRLYLQMALVLAAGETEPDRRADTWLRAALRRKCFWRYVGAGLMGILAVAGGFLALVIPGFMICGMIALAQPFAVLERRQPLEAIRLSIHLSRGHRRPLAIVFFFFVLLPELLVQVGFMLSGAKVPGWRWTSLDLVTVFLLDIALIALTRAYCRLQEGGPREPGEVP